MGCDIHLHTEIKINGNWEHYSQPRLKRSYSLFAKMADVRNYELLKPISKPRGLPEDITNTTRFCTEYCSGYWYHSHSWLNSSEVRDLIVWYKWCKPWDYIIEIDLGIGYLFGNSWKGWCDPNTENYYPEKLEDFRWIFWFDN